MSSRCEGNTSKVPRGIARENVGCERKDDITQSRQVEVCIHKGSSTREERRVDEHAWP
jgi:hypothetical protein